MRCASPQALPDSRTGGARCRRGACADHHDEDLEPGDPGVVQSRGPGSAEPGVQRRRGDGGRPHRPGPQWSPKWATRWSAWRWAQTQGNGPGLVGGVECPMAAPGDRQRPAVGSERRLRSQGVRRICAVMSEGATGSVALGEFGVRVGTAWCITSCSNTSAPIRAWLLDELRWPDVAAQEDMAGMETGEVDHRATHRRPAGPSGHRRPRQGWCRPRRSSCSARPVPARPVSPRPSRHDLAGRSSNSSDDESQLSSR